jgi:small subunit ribosomal protein S18
MARSNDRDRSTRRGPKDTGRRMKKKVCIFCTEHIESVDYKEVNLLRKFMSDRGKIRARRVSGNCAQHQRDVAVAIKTARELALLPYAQRTTSDRQGGGGRSGRGGGRPGGALEGGDRRRSSGAATSSTSAPRPVSSEAPVSSDVDLDAAIEAEPASVDDSSEAVPR